MGSIPESTKILVIGGGPGGSTAATLLARQGYDVTLMEQARFPRYHIGESLLPTILPIMDLLGAREKMERMGFQRKQGAYIEWGSETWSLDFGELSGNTTYAFQVVRSEFDQMLLEHARTQGVHAFEGVKVRKVSFEDGRPVRAQWEAPELDGNANRQGWIAFDYLIDASGRNSLLATQYLRNRRYHRVFQNIALWSYWKGANRLATGREGDIAVSSIPAGWLWGIPLHDGTMSVGLVIHQEGLKARKGQSKEEILAESIGESGIIQEILDGAERVPGLYTETDYSYASSKFSGPGFFLVGDAACFLDPLLSSGVHLATFSAMLAAAGLHSFFSGEVSEAELENFYEKSYRQAYLRFLVFLSAFYDVGRKKESYFYEAQRLTQEDVSASELRHAFLRLVTGVKDLSDAQNGATHQFVLQEMSERINNNLRFRKDKLKLSSLEGGALNDARENASFFDSVEGLFSLNADDAVDGLYITTTPDLRLARTDP